MLILWSSKQFNKRCTADHSQHIARKKRPRRRCFPMNFRKFFKYTLLYRTNPGKRFWKKSFSLHVMLLHKSTCTRTRRGEKVEIADILIQNFDNNISCTQAVNWTYIRRSKDDQDVSRESLKYPSVSSQFLLSRSRLLHFTKTFFYILRHI